MKKSVTAIVVICLSSILLGGCAQETKRIEIPEAPVVEGVTDKGMTPSGTVTIEGDLKQEKFDFTNSVKGKPIKKIVISHKDSELLDERVILFIGSIVGNEPIGTPIITKMIEHIKTQPQLLKNRKVVFLPQVNPDGVESHSRENVKGVDINRDFPKDKENAEKCQPETQAVIEMIETYKPERIISIRQLDAIDFDFPDELLKEQDDMIRYLKKQNPGMYFKDDSVKPGSLGEYGSKILEIPVISFGVGKHQPDERKLWEKYGNGLIALITYPDDSVITHDDSKSPVGVEEEDEPPIITYKPEKTSEEVACDSGKSLFRQGKYSAAKVKLNSCRDDKKSVSYLNAIDSYEKGERLYGNHDYDGAIVEFRRVFSLNKNDKKLKDYIRKCSKKDDPVVKPVVNKPLVKKPEKKTPPIIEESLDSDKIAQVKESEKQQKEAADKQRESEKQLKEAAIAEESKKQQKEAADKKESEKQLKEVAEKQKDLEKQQKEAEKQRDFDSVFKLAQGSFSSGDYSSAKENFEKAAQIKECGKCKEYAAKSEKAKAVSESGLQAFNGNNYKKAIGHFEDVVKINPEDHKAKGFVAKSKQAIYDKGKKHFMNKQFAETITELSQLDGGYKPANCSECKTAGDIINIAKKAMEKKDVPKKE